MQIKFRFWENEDGFIQAALGLAGLLAPLFGGGAKKAQEQRTEEAKLNLGRDQLATSQYGTAQNAVFNKAQQDLQNKQFGLNAPSTRAKQATLGDLLANIQDAKITAPSGIRMGNITGGLRPSALGPNARAAGGELSRQALMALMDQRDQKFQDMPLLNPPAISQTPKAGKLENIFGTIGTIGGILGGLGQSGIFNGGGGQSQAPMAAGGAGAVDPNTGLVLNPDLYKVNFGQPNG